MACAMPGSADASSLSANITGLWSDDRKQSRGVDKVLSLLC